MKQKKKNDAAELHKDLKGFDIKINEFGEISSSFPIERLNQFLNKNVDDKKLRHQSAQDDDKEPSQNDNTDDEA